MHGGFTALRQELPMNCCKRASMPALSRDAAQDVARVQTIWRDARHRYGGSGQFLFGAFGIADAMYAPVALRFIGHGAELDSPARTYVDAIAALPALREWLAEAATEPLSPVHERTKP
jgi:glutathione S-transferase